LIPEARSSSIAATACAVILLLLATERPAHAYIDPGSGSLIYQTALTVLLGAGFLFRRAFASIGRLFRGRPQERDASGARGSDHR
jgi:hypothetical protein